MDDLGREKYPHDPYIPIHSRRVHDMARVRDLGVEFVSQVTYFLYLLKNSSIDLLKKNLSSFTQFG